MWNRRTPARRVHAARFIRQSTTYPYLADKSPLHDAQLIRQVRGRVGLRPHFADIITFGGTRG
jgi:hypothetical protein